MHTKLLFGALALATSVLAQAVDDKAGADCGACNAIYQTCMETCITDGPSFPGKHSTCNSWCFCKTADFEDCGTKCGYDESVCKGKVSNGQKQHAVDDALINIKRVAHVAEFGDAVIASTTSASGSAYSTRKPTSRTTRDRPHIPTCLPGVGEPCEDPRFTIQPPSVTESVSFVKSSSSTVSPRRSRPNDFPVSQFVTEIPHFSTPRAPVVVRSPQTSPRPISCIPCDKRYNTCITKNACPAGQNACTNECNCDTADYDNCGVKCWFYREACPLPPAVLKADNMHHPNTSGRTHPPHTHTRPDVEEIHTHENGKRQFHDRHHSKTTSCSSTSTKEHIIHARPPPTLIPHTANPFDSQPSTTSKGRHSHSHTWETRVRSSSEETIEHDKRQVLGLNTKTSISSSTTSKYHWPAHGGHGPVVKSSSLAKTPSSMLALWTTASEPIETDRATSPRDENSFGTLQACPGCPGLIQRCVKIPCRGNEPEYISCVCDNLTPDCDASCWRNECRRDLSAMLPQWCASLGELPPA